MFINPFIHSISFYLPEKCLTNQNLSEIYNDWNPQKILDKTGIKERHVAAVDEFASDMAINAANSLFQQNSLDAGEIDFVLLGTQSPDYYLPTTACLIQEKLGLSNNCGALDFNLGCSAFIYGLALAKSLVIGGIANNVLLIVSETYTKHIHQLDKSTRTIFGDGAAAVLIKSDDSINSNIGEFILGTDGSGAQNLIIPAGGMRMPRTADTDICVIDDNGNVRSKNNIYMNGPEIFNFTIRVVPKLVNDVLMKNNKQIDNIDLFVFHQANKYMLDHLRRKLHIPENKFYINIENIGNTVSASIPIALKCAQEDGYLKRGNLVMLVGFGVGYSWGATIIRW